MKRSWTFGAHIYMDNRIAVVRSYKTILHLVHFPAFFIQKITFQPFKDRVLSISYSLPSFSHRIFRIYWYSFDSRLLVCIINYKT